MFRPIDVESSNKHATTTSWNVAFDMNVSLVRVLLKLRTSWLTAVMAFGGPTVAQLYRMVELMNPGRIVDIMILMGTNNASKSSDAENSLRVNAGVPVYHSVAKISACGTDRLHHTDGHENTTVHRKKTQ